MKLSKQGNGEWLSSDGNICVQNPHKMDPLNTDKYYYAFKTFSYKTWGHLRHSKKLKIFSLFTQSEV